MTFKATHKIEYKDHNGTRIYLVQKHEHAYYTKDELTACDSPSFEDRDGGMFPTWCLPNGAEWKFLPMWEYEKVYEIGFAAGKECAQFCWENCMEDHRGEPIWPGDGELVGKKLGCDANQIEEHLDHDVDCIQALWRGFKAGTQKHKEERPINHYYIQSRKPSESWSPAHLGMRNEFKTKEEAADAVRSLIALGDDWAVDDWRVVDDKGDVHITWVDDDE